MKHPLVQLSSALPLLLLTLSISSTLSSLSALPAAATVNVFGPDEGSIFFALDKPTGQPDEAGLSGFEFFMSGTTGQFNSNDMYLIRGEDTNEIDAIARNLGDTINLNAVPFTFSIQHNLIGGRNFTFSLTNQDTAAVDILCWGLNCATGTNVTSAETINGAAPINDYNGLQLQVRAQDVIGSSVYVGNLALSGVDLSTTDLFDETVTPSTLGTISPFDFGRRGQWFIGDDLDLVVNEWELSGTVILTRPDLALTDRTKVRLAVDFVRDPRQPVVPEPSTALLLGFGLGGLVLFERRFRVA